MSEERPLIAFKQFIGGVIVSLSLGLIYPNR